jgi:AcrR family transcriptional regulator
VRTSSSSGTRTPINEADPRVKRTRKLLEDAFIELLGEKSFEAITVQDIAARSTINRATFYAHFVDKYDLFSRFSRDWFRGTLQDEFAGAADYSHESIRRLVLATMHALANLNDHCHPTEALKPLIVSAVQEELALLLRTWLQPVITTHGTSDLDAAVSAFSWAIFGAAMQWSQLPERPPAEPIAKQLATILTRGLPVRASSAGGP